MEKRLSHGCLPVKQRLNLFIHIASKRCIVRSMNQQEIKTPAPLPKVRHGRYIVTNLSKPPKGLLYGQLYFRDTAGILKPIGPKGKWSIPRSIVADRNWLYICDTGNVFRVNPENGTIDPPGRFEGFRLSSLTRSIWIYEGWLYGTARAERDGDIFVDIYRVKLSAPHKKAVLVASQVRMDVPSTETSQDASVFVDVASLRSPS